MRFRLVPTDTHFFTLFSSAAENMQECATHIRLLVEGPNDAAASSVERCEKQGDQITRSVLERLEKSFVTPFDREDIHALAEEMDDVVDEMHNAAALLGLFPQGRGSLDELTKQADLLIIATERTVALAASLDGLRGVRPILEDLHRLESEADSVHRKLLQRLFSGEFDALSVLRWKDVAESLEEAIDHVEDLSDVVERILVKQT